MSLLQRFSSKIDTCKNVIEHPVIKSLLQSQHHQKKFWCYFCELEFSQHVISESWLILEQGFLDHLTSMAHEKNTRKFFRKNCLKDFNKFLLSRIDFNRHLTNTEIALEAYKDELQQKMLKEMKKISENERKRKMFSKFIQDNQSPPENNKYSISKCETKTKGKKTVAVFSPGLTCINFKDAIDHGTGNIFTNALPPWLQNVKPLNNKIGPTFGDFENYLKNQRRQKLPQERVGANLDEKFTQSDFWLPSFGQVWNNNCRLQSKQDFLKHMKRTPASDSFVRLFRLSCSTATCNVCLRMLTHVTTMFRPIAVSPVSLFRLRSTAEQPTTLCHFRLFFFPKVRLNPCFLRMSRLPPSAFEE
ncbi:unnamed protein product [Acanthosepion pharaonis]|uniref:Uncharacterized protein n=1 Tax=Acanthosepion pharaonis TaxID=158019 RepID=A0A812CPM4_ACAPH|nr:unnamed protein product [Sepia pharaonis]